MKQQLADRDTTIAVIRNETREFPARNDALEQYGHRTCLRISGISDTEEDTTVAVIKLSSDVLKIDLP